jgi:hypothetical protein
MNRTTIRLLVVDAVLLVAEFYVIQDLMWRTNYAATIRDVCPQACSYTPSFSYNVLTQYFTMSGNGVNLTSPITLDWVQVITLVLIVINGWFAYSTLKKRRSNRTMDTAAAAAPTV